MAKRRQSFSPEFKAKVVLEVLTRVKGGGEACREYGIRSQLLSKWKAEFLENASRAFGKPNDLDPEDRARIAELERLAGRQALEIEVLHLPWGAVPGKKASSILNSHRGGSGS